MPGGMCHGPRGAWAQVPFTNTALCGGRVDVLAPAAHQHLAPWMEVTLQSLVVFLGRGQGRGANSTASTFPDLQFTAPGGPHGAPGPYLWPRRWMLLPALLQACSAHSWPKVAQPRAQPCEGKANADLGSPSVTILSPQTQRLWLRGPHMCLGPWYPCLLLGPLLPWPQVGRCPRETSEVTRVPCVYPFLGIPAAANHLCWLSKAFKGLLICVYNF